MGRTMDFILHFHFRSPELVMNDIEYLGLDGEKNLYFTFLKATEFIQSAVEKVNLQNNPLSDNYCQNLQQDVETLKL